MNHRLKKDFTFLKNYLRPFYNSSEDKIIAIEPIVVENKTFDDIYIDELIDPDFTFDPSSDKCTFITTTNTTLIELKNKNLITNTMQFDRTNFCVYIIGPTNSIYEGNKFMFNVIIPQGYPIKPPKVYCLTPIIHDNISEIGGICLETLRDGWSPQFGLIQLLMSIRTLLFAGRTHSNIVGSLTLTDITAYEEKCKNIKQKLIMS